MRKLCLTIHLLIVTVSVTFAQVLTESTVDVKVGLGPLAIFANENSRLPRHNIMVGVTEAEITKRLNKVFSTSAALNVGYGKITSMVSSEVDFQAFVTQLNANLFLSPFGNYRRYNAKLGTGASLFFVSDKLVGGTVERNEPDLRLTTGVNFIFENEFSVGERSLLGLKTMVQAYANGDFTGSLLFKYGIRL